MPKVKIDGLNLYYEIHGEGFPLIMIMGISADTYWWDSAIIEELSKEFKVVIFDHIGIGRSDGPARTQIKIMADDTVGLMNALDIEKTHVFGISFGGNIAQELVLNYPEKVEKLILSSTTCGGSKAVRPSSEVNQLFMRFTTVDHDLAIAKEVVSLLFTEDFIEKNSKYIEEKLKDITRNITTASNFTNQLQAGMKFNSSERLNQISIPTLILQGKKDIVCPPKNGEILANLISGAQLIYFDESPHSIFVPDFDKFNKSVIKFLQ